MGTRQRACRMVLVAALAATALVGGSTIARCRGEARGYGRVLQAAQKTPPHPDAATDRVMALYLSRHDDRQPHLPGLAREADERRDGEPAPEACAASALPEEPPEGRL
ncbi:hypothetical protein [Solidesulfovibrio sp.]|uniref:hypothetical protein n=1 Tax=Solidesulfovibrio sp. TaxID=2910990 RepID=UPI00260FA2DD|nr:hypothetical protein [Solidesulfovibrio sp.]